VRLTIFIKQFRKSIIFAGSLVLVENLAWIVEPTVFGRVIDAFIDKGLSHVSMEFIVPLAVWIGVFLINSGVGALRRSIEPRIYLKIFTRIAVDVTRDSLNKGLSISKTAARADLMREYIAFFQYRVPEIIEQAITIGGAIIALTIFDYRIGIACLTAVFPLSYLTATFSRKIEKLQAVLHDTREEAYEAFTTRDIARVEDYYNRLAAPEKKIAHLGGINFGIVRFFLLGIFLVVLFISIDMDDFSTGNIYSIVAYLWTFVTSTEYLPELMESWTSLKELNQRTKEQRAIS
jgi:ABC-type multidrug transport system fused ATPase/permease subunit